HPRLPARPRGSGPPLRAHRCPPRPQDDGRGHSRYAEPGRREPADRAHQMRRGRRGGVGCARRGAESGPAEAAGGISAGAGNFGAHWRGHRGMARGDRARDPGAGRDWRTRRPRSIGRARTGLTTGHIQSFRQLAETAKTHRRFPAARRRSDRRMSISAHDIARVLSEALPYMQRYDEATVVVKYGGTARGDKKMPRESARDIVLLEQTAINPIVVHGGGPQIEAMLKK